MHQMIFIFTLTLHVLNLYSCSTEEDLAVMLATAMSLSETPPPLSIAPYNYQMAFENVFGLCSQAPQQPAVNSPAPQSTEDLHAYHIAEKSLQDFMSKHKFDPLLRPIPYRAHASSLAEEIYLNAYYASNQRQAKFYYAVWSALQACNTTPALHMKMNSTNLQAILSPTQHERRRLPVPPPITHQMLYNFVKKTREFQLQLGIPTVCGTRLLLLSQPMLQKWEKNYCRTWHYERVTAVLPVGSKASLEMQITFPENHNDIYEEPWEYYNTRFHWYPLLNGIMARYKAIPFAKNIIDKMSCRKGNAQALLLLFGQFMSFRKVIEEATPFLLVPILRHQSPRWGNIPDSFMGHSLSPAQRKKLSYVAKQNLACHAAINAYDFLCDLAKSQGTFSTLTDQEVQDKIGQPVKDMCSTLAFQKFEQEFKHVHELNKIYWLDLFRNFWKIYEFRLHSGK